MKRIVLAVSVQLVVFSWAALAPAQTESRGEPARNARRGVAADKSQQQEPPAQQASDNTRFQYKPVVFQLRHADCMEVSGVLSRIFFKSTVVAIPRISSIVYAGPDETLPQVKELLGQIDMPVGEAEAPLLTMIPVRHRSVKDIMDELGKVLSGRDRADFRIAADPGRFAILLRGPKLIAEEARSLVEQLDKPVGTVVLEFAFFHADLNRDAAPGKIPADLRPVAEELGARFGALDLLGLLSTVAIENENFTVEGALSASISQVRVHGRFSSPSSEDAVRLEIGASLKFGGATPAADQSETSQDKQETSRPAQRPSFELQTVVQTNRGDYVVVGSAPTGWAAGESVILVMHVRP